MKTLTNQQLDHLRTSLYQAGATPTQVKALLPVMAQEVEHYMWIGLPFDAAIDKVELEADYSTVSYLHDKQQNTLVMADEASERPGLDELVFANRNRAYGAYDLRKSYDSAMVTAIIMTVGIVLLVLAALDAFQRGEWVYLSWSGLAWVVGVHLVGFAGFRFYLGQVRNKE